MKSPQLSNVSASLHHDPSGSIIPSLCVASPQRATLSAPLTPTCPSTPSPSATSPHCNPILLSLTHLCRHIHSLVFLSHSKLKQAIQSRRGYLSLERRSDLELPACRPAASPSAAPRMPTIPTPCVLPSPSLSPLPSSSSPLKAPSSLSVSNNNTIY